MENVNKFKVFTIIIICTFVFAIGAIYSNTKDVTTDKAAEQKETYQEDYGRYSRNSSEDIQTEIRNINRRLDELNSQIGKRSQNSASSGTNLTCKIAGTLSRRGMEEMSPSAAVNDARINNNDLVVLCSF